jgi:predicted RND superfamily exporter protein
MEVRPMMETVPRTPEEIARLKEAVASMPIYINALVSPDGKAATVVADFKQDERSPNFIALNEAMNEIVNRERERDADIDIYLGGITIIGEAADRHFLQMPMFFGAALVIILLVQYWSFRSLQGMVLPMLTGILSVVWSLGLMGLLGVHLDPLNTTTPILVLAVAAGHAIQILKRYYEEYGRLRASGVAPREANREAVIESMVRVGPVMIVAGLIATITFLSLAGTGIPMVQHFGVFAGCGVLATMIIEMTVIPAVRSMLRPPRDREAAREREAGVLDRFLTGVADNLVGGRAPVVVAAGLAVLAVVGFGVTRLRIDNNFKLYFNPDSDVRVHDRILNDTFGGTNSIQFLVTTPETDGIKDPRSAADRGQDAVDGRPDQADESGHARRRHGLLHRSREPGAGGAVPVPVFAVRRPAGLRQPGGQRLSPRHRVGVRQGRQHDQRGPARKTRAGDHRRELPAGRDGADGREPPAAHRAQRRHRG